MIKQVHLNKHEIQMKPTTVSIELGHEYQDFFET